MQDDRDHCSYKDIRDNPNWHPTKEDILWEKQAEKDRERMAKLGLYGFEAASYMMKEYFDKTLAEEYDKRSMNGR